MIHTFTKETYHRDLDRLAQRNPRIRELLSAWGYPPFWSREKGFPGLVRIILEQQVSLISARATWHRLLEQIGPPTPEAVAAAGVHTLRSWGITRQKAGYLCGLAGQVLEAGPGRLDLDGLDALPDEAVRDRLIRIKGIGPWTADIYLIMALNRRDIFPAGDLALQKAWVEFGFSAPPAISPAALQDATARFSPFRSLLACLLWHGYILHHRIRPG